MIHKMYALSEHIPEGIISSLENEYDLELNPFPNLKVITLDFKKEDIDIARRTVAKYREGLGILSSSKRKKLF